MLLQSKACLLIATGDEIARSRWRAACPAGQHGLLWEGFGHPFKGEEDSAAWERNGSNSECGGYGNDEAVFRKVCALGGLIGRVVWRRLRAR